MSVVGLNYERKQLVELCDGYTLDGSAVTMLSMSYLISGKLSIVTPLVSPC